MLEESNNRLPTLAELLSKEEPATATSKGKKRYATYRSYMGGNCQNCNKPLGLIEVEGGRDQTSMVGEGIAPSTANPEPCVSVSTHTAPQCMVKCD